MQKWQKNKIVNLQQSSINIKTNFLPYSGNHLQDRNMVYSGIKLYGIREISVTFHTLMFIIFIYWNKQDYYLTIHFSMLKIRIISVIYIILGKFGYNNANGSLFSFNCLLIIRTISKESQNAATSTTYIYQILKLIQVKKPHSYKNFEIT